MFDDVAYQCQPAAVFRCLIYFFIFHYFCGVMPVGVANPIATAYGQRVARRASVIHKLDYGERRNMLAYSYSKCDPNGQLLVCSGWY
ncbi:hypothetical protein O9992_19880 [Vibrio lentus]|nr:hypothetical protein [Vibrio lentus]